MKPFRELHGVAIYHGDAMPLLRSMDSEAVNLVFTSPPYEAARQYGIDFRLRGQQWVDWYLPYALELYRVCGGLTAINCEGQTRNYCYSATPFLLLADLHRAGVTMRKPAIFHRHGIPGQGRPDWLRNDWEPILCLTHGRLPWSDNTAMGHPPKPGSSEGRQLGNRRPNGDKNPSLYKTPALANPGNVISCHVGGGHMGSRMASRNEASFPEKLAEFFIRSFCPPGGVVLDPMAGSGTVGSVAIKTGRKAILCDVRKSQCELMVERIEEAHAKKRTACKAA